jgi:hypothetical protein
MSIMRFSLRTPTVAVVVAAALMAVATPARASCTQRPPEDALRSNDVVFTGQVIETVAGGRVAVVEVQSIWKGGDILSVARVEGGDVDSPSRDDRTFETGLEYVFFPLNDKPPFRENGCTATTELTPEVARLEPEDARAPTPGGSNPLLAVVIVAIVAAGIYQARRALRKSPGGRGTQRADRLRTP